EAAVETVALRPAADGMARVHKPAGSFPHPGRTPWHESRYAPAMPDDSPTIALRVVESLSAVDGAQWDACALAPGAAGNPFLSHRFLKALEDSKSVGRRTGWQPQYLLAETDDGALQGAVPLYMKSHSQGEYIFDHGWAQAFERAGGRYYPKLQ